MIILELEISTTNSLFITVNLLYYCLFVFKNAYSLGKNGRKEGRTCTSRLGN
jgi:hypothetical protein